MSLQSLIAFRLVAGVAAWDCGGEHLSLCHDVPVNIKIHGNNNTLKAYENGALYVAPADASVSESVLEQFTLVPVSSGKYNLELLGGTTNKFLSVTDNSMDVTLSYRDEGRGLQSWDLRWTNQFWEIHHDHMDALLAANSDGTVTMSKDEKIGFQFWDIEPTGCYVLDPDHSQITGKWVSLGETVTCSSCTIEYDTGIVRALYQTREFVSYFKTKLKEVSKAGLRLSGFATKANLTASLREEVTTALETAFTSWEYHEGSVDTDPSDEGKEVWQFVIEATDICGQPVTTKTRQVAFVEPGHEPCCVAGVNAPSMWRQDSTTCAGDDYLMPGAERQSYCQVRNKLEFTV